MGARRVRRSAAIVTLAAAFALPGSAGSVPLLSQIVECQGAAIVGGGTFSCTKVFTIPANEGRQSSDLETHANFHARVAEGTVTMTWYNQRNEEVVRFTCTAPGLYLQVSPTGSAVGGGPADLSPHPMCRPKRTDNEFFATGPQRLVVTATATRCWMDRAGENASSCPFHGYLALNEPGPFL